MLIVEILSPPRNIQVLSKNGNTIIKWHPPASIAINGLQDGMTSTYDSEEEDNFIYEIRVTENISKRIFRVSIYRSLFVQTHNISQTLRLYLKIKLQNKIRILATIYITFHLYRQKSSHRV